MRVVFMGTPDFSVGTLEAIVAAGHQVAAVVTQPDKPRGRGKSLQMTAVKEAALRHELTVYQPAKIRDEEFVRTLTKLNPEVIVVVAFGRIITKDILELPRLGCINVHASLLPKYRGAAPIQWVVINGEKESGVTIMRMDEGLDTGDMIAKTVVPLAADETGGSLFEKLSAAGAGLLVETLAALADGSARFEQQPQESTTEYAGMITKQMGFIDWGMTAVDIERLIRGLDPWPSAYTHLNGKTLKLWQAFVSDENFEADPGQVVRTDESGLWVQTKAGALCIRQLQLEGKKRMDADVFLRGCPVSEGTMLG